MTQVIDDIFQKGQVVDEQGNIHSLHSHTSREQCLFLQGLIREIAPESCIEIGLAYGISTLFMLEGLTGNGKPFTYTVMDPFQKEHWNDIGLTNIQRMGYREKVRFLPKFSDQVLPQLYNEGHRIQFAYVDSTKVFDVLMVDVYFLAKMLDIGGLIVLDDCGFPGIRALARFITQHPSFEVYKGFSKEKFSSKRTLLRRADGVLIDLIPFKSRVWENYNFATDEELGVDYHCLAFRKIKEDERSWNWFAAF